MILSLSKIVDGCFFFLIFKVCQYLWDRVYNLKDTQDECLDELILEKMNEIFDYLQEETDPEPYDDESAPDYEFLTASLSEKPHVPPRFYEENQVKEAYIV